jgi:Dullard-like phosphatase family protein
MNSNTPINKKFIYTGGNKNIISNYYNNNFYNTPIRSYVEQSSFYLGYNAKKSRSLNNSVKNVIDKSKIKKYNRIYEKENCININLSSSPISMNERFYSNINNQNYNYSTNIDQYEINSNFIFEYSSPNNKSQNKSIKNYHFSINFEELMILGEKLFEIVKSLINNKKMANECFEFWNYFYNSELPKGIQYLILNSELKESIYSINYTLMSILICYDYSFDITLVEKCFSLLKETLDLIVNNYIIFCKYIIQKVSKKNKNNKWIYKLNNMLSNNNVYSNININNYNNNEFIINHNSSVEKIIYNTNIIIKNLNIILEHFKSNSNESLLILFKKISQKNYEDINYYYRTFLLREENINGSFLASLYLKDNPNFHSVKEPYIRQPNNKRYALILDLEETILNFRLKSENKGEGVLKLRPGLYEFLDAVQKFYEIILFTASSQDYAENLIDNIEEKKKYFEYKFFRQHNIIIENDFVKDLSRIGRDLDKMIIVDNMPQNYRLHKKNGINIKGFWGEELNDRILFNLKDILIRIAKEGGDLIIGLGKYHEHIAENVASRIYQFNFE